MVYNIFDRESFDYLERFLIDIEKNSNEKLIKLLIGNKINFDNNRKVLYDEGKKFADLKEIYENVNCETKCENKIIKKKRRRKKNQCINF